MNESRSAKPSDFRRTAPSQELTQTQLAERLKCHQSMIARVESGERRIDTVELIVICRAICCDPKGILDHVAAAVPADHHL